MAEKSSWDQANRRQKLGLVWRNRKKISQIIKDYFYLLFFLLIILWFTYIMEIQELCQRDQRRVGPCWRLKMGWMGTQREQMKGALSWLVRLARWAPRAGTRDFYPALAALVSPAQNIIFLAVYYFNLCVPHHPATWAGSRSVLPVSECGSSVYSAVLHAYYTTFSAGISNNLWGLGTE
jgi:hypothetical protein